MLDSLKIEFIEFMMSADVLRFGQFLTKSGRHTPYFVNTGNYRTGGQIAKLGDFYAALVKEACGPDFLTVTPGVRFADGDAGDQKRVMTPAAAKEIGSDYIVVGRPITAAADPVAAYERCVAEFCD